MLKQIYSFGGLNLRDSVINRNEAQASDLLNVELDSQRQVIQRSGFNEAVDASGINVVDTLEYRKTRELLVMADSGLQKKVGSTLIPINFGGNVPANTWAEGIDHAEYSNTLYFTDVAGNNELFKYDGYMQYRAGVPQASAVRLGGGSGTSYYYRLMLYHIDLQGNITWGDYVQFDSTIATQNFTFDTLNNTEFHNKYGTTASGPNQIIDSTNLSLNLHATNPTNYLAGDGLRVQNSAGVWKTLIVDTITTGPNVLTFTLDSVGSDTFGYFSGRVLESRTFVLLARSLDATFGYEVNSYKLVDNSIPTNNIVPLNVNEGGPLNDVYDTGIVRQLPPRCRYITVYGGTTLVLGNYANTKDLQNDLQNTSPQQESTIFWSSVYSEFGTSVENFLPFYREIAGKSDEGEIKGLFGASDSLIILKENQVYYLNGILQEQTSRPRSSLSERVGCISHRSIVEAIGGCLFMSPKGVYLAKFGTKPVEISDIIQPLFTSDTVGLDISRSRGVIDYLQEKVYWFIPATLPKDNLVIVFDYYYKEWFKHSGINADSGLTLINDVDLYHCDNTNIHLRDGSLNDNNQKITAYYATHWHHLGGPSIRKKFTNFILASISSLIWDCNVKTQEDWIETDRTDITIPMDDVIMVDDKRLNITQSKSCRFIISNNKKSQSLLLTGYEFEYETTQESPKGES